MKLNLGCASQIPVGWINVDYALGARFAKIPFFRVFNRKLKLFNLDWSESILLHDLTKKFPWSDSSIDVVYSSHTLEHFTKEDGRRFIVECHRVLRKNGVIRIVVPDFHQLMVEYNEGNIKADEFVEKLDVLYHSDNFFKKVLAPFIQFPHKCMYDGQSLIRILDEIGFDATSRAPFESDIAEIRLVELEGRTQKSVIVEGRKR